MVEWLGVVAGAWVLMAHSSILQIRRIVVRRTSAHVSLAYLAVLQLGFGLWVAYGLALGNPFSYVPNGMAAIVDGATILVALRFRRTRG